MKTKRSVLLASMLVIHSIFFITIGVAGEKGVKKDVRAILLRRRHRGDPSYYNRLLAYSKEKNVPTKELRSCVITIVSRALHKPEDRVQSKLMDSGIDVLRNFAGSDVVSVMRKIKHKTKDENLRREAIRGIVSAETESLLRRVRELLHNERLSDIDRFAIYEELIKRLETKTGSKVVSERHQSDIIALLKTRVSKEQSLGNAIKLDKFLKKADGKYRSGETRIEMLMEGRKSDVQEHSLYCQQAMQSLEQGGAAMSDSPPETNEVHEEKQKSNTQKAEGGGDKPGGSSFSWMGIAGVGVAMFVVVGFVVMLIRRNVDS